MRWLTRILILSLFLIPTTRSSAQSDSLVSNVTLTYEFGNAINVSAEILNAKNYSAFTLILRPDGQSSRQIELHPDADGKGIVRYDLKQDPLKPFARIYYWFEFENLDKTSSTSPSYWFDYLDNRFLWKSNESNLFQISWVEGDTSYGQKLQDIAREGFIKATQILPVAPELPIRIYVYPGIEKMQEAIALTNQSWAAGHSSPDIGVILVSNGSPPAKLIEMERQIPHELMHILQYQIAGAQYRNIPVWLSEGLATYAEIYPDPDLERVLNESYESGNLILFESLCSGFSQDAATAQLGYAQSVSFVNYLNGRFGSEFFPELIENSKSGQNCTNSIESVLHISLAQLQKDWQEITFAQKNGTELNNVYILVIICVAVIGLVGTILIIRSKSKKTISRYE
ncbi:MAG: hypothetical protein FD147_231 [Chloroflexi bacterium]|nr:MAG: hypothetical protein FD147_231 [Chloroflexota bacterium]MBA4376281.1 hypothetical protein [Anaerolinea sp.]